MSLFTHLRSDTRRDAWSDAIAGALTAAVLIPQALAAAADSQDSERSGI